MNRDRVQVISDLPGRSGAPVGVLRCDSCPPYRANQPRCRVENGPGDEKNFVRQKKARSRYEFMERWARSVACFDRV